MSSPSGPAALPPGSKAKLTVVKGKRAGKTYGVKEGGVTYIGGAGKFPVDVNLDEQDRPGVLANRHALVYYEKGMLSIADTKTPNGTFVNKVRLQPGKRYALKGDDLIQVGNVTLQVKVIIKKRTGVQK